MTAARDAAAVASALAGYRRGVLPPVRGELEEWAGRAKSIPDRELREAALSALREKGSNAEATAIFAILAPRAWRPAALRAMTALQVAVDYLDTLGEERVGDPLASGLALHRALADAVSPGGGQSDWYERYPRGEDGGYLAALVDACRRELAGLPASEVVGPAMRPAAVRCGEGQGYTHAAALGWGGLEEWATRQGAPPGYRWWEVAAGASSSVAIHALIAAAADPRTSVEEAELIDAAHFPPIGALTVLLDDLVDWEEDAAAGQHNHMSCYESSEEAAERLAWIAEQARAAIEPLRHRSRHAAILAGVAGYYLADPQAETAFAAPVRERMLDVLGAPARLVIASRRLRRRG